MSPRGRAAVFALLRVVSGLLFACHGGQKLFGAFGAEAARAPLMILAGVIEFVGGLCIAAGLLTRVSALLAAGEMATAYFLMHASKGLWPIRNGGEPAVLYCFIFLAVAAAGAGEFGLDAVRDRRRSGVSSGVSAAAARARRALPQDPWSSRWPSRRPAVTLIRGGRP